MHRSHQEHLCLSRTVLPLVSAFLPCFLGSPVYVFSLAASQGFGQSLYSDFESQP